MLTQSTHVMAATADITVYSRDRRSVLAVEVKGLSAPTAQGAAGLRRDLLLHQLLPEATFFLLVYSTTMFLWRKETPPAAPPDCSASAEAVFKDYRAAMSKGALQIAVFNWLSTIASGIREVDPASPAEQMLVQSGLYGEIRHGNVQFEADV